MVPDVSVYSFIILEAKQLDVRTGPGGLAKGVGSFRSVQDKAIADKEQKGPGEMSHLLHC